MSKEALPENEECINDQLTAALRFSCTARPLQHSTRQRRACLFSTRHRRPESHPQTWGSGSTTCVVLCKGSISRSCLGSLLPCQSVPSLRLAVPRPTRLPQL